MNTANRQQKNKVRIIGGMWRSRVVEFRDVEGLRPTPDRVRETLFNWLREDLAGSRCLDLFAGSGILGFEALSRGAAKLVQVERDVRVGGQLELAGAGLGCELAGKELRCFTMSAAEWIASWGDEGEVSQFDVIFLDPPFGSSLLLETCALLADARLVAPAAKIYLESAEPVVAEQLPAGWCLKQQKQAGDVCYGLASC
ncbi:MAG: 16S rRNA (guanine(966)-N(2))-methyltransferase RsmD [Pseudohongiellaceae bacterium]